MVMMRYGTVVMHYRSVVMLFYMVYLVVIARQRTLYCMSLPMFQWLTAGEQGAPVTTLESNKTICINADTQKHIQARATIIFV